MARNERNQVETQLLQLSIPQSPPPPPPEMNPLNWNPNSVEFIPGKLYQSNLRFLQNPSPDPSLIPKEIDPSSQQSEHYPLNVYAQPYPLSHLNLSNQDRSSTSTASNLDPYLKEDSSSSSPLQPRYARQFSASPQPLKPLRDQSPTTLDSNPNNTTSSNSTLFTTHHSICKDGLQPSPSYQHYQHTISNAIRLDLSNRAIHSLHGNNPQDPLVQSLPTHLQHYHSLYPLEDLTKYNVSKVFFVPSFFYKASDGYQTYAIRKVDHFGMTGHELNHLEINMWKSLQHPNIVALKDAFISNAFNQVNAFFFAYDYYPGSETLQARFNRIHSTHFKPIFFQSNDRYPSCDTQQNGNRTSKNVAIEEDLIWSILIQLILALKAIHAKGLAAFQLLHATKIIISGQNRVRLGSTGISHIFESNVRPSMIISRQHADMVNLGLLMLSLICPNENNKKAIHYISANYSIQLHTIIIRLLGLVGRSNDRGVSSTPNTVRFEELEQIMSNKLCHIVESQYDYTDLLEHELTKELHNGRLFRLLTKLGFINERPEYDYHSAWSETGDRYPLKLFRDYLFHQVDEEGNPNMDISHVVECLNKLELGTEEQVLLATRDTKSMMMFKYSDLRRFVQESFQELYQQQLRSIHANHSSLDSRGS